MLELVLGHEVPNVEIMDGVLSSVILSMQLPELFIILRSLNLRELIMIFSHKLRLQLLRIQKIPSFFLHFI